MTPYLTFTWVKAIMDIGMYVSTMAVVFLDSKDEIFGISDKTVWTILPKLPLQFRWLGASLTCCLWQPAYTYTRFLVSAILKVLFTLFMISLVNEVHTKRFKAITKYLIYGFGMTLVAVDATFEAPRGILLAVGKFGWKDEEGVSGDHITATLFIIGLSAISTYFAYWKINPMWPLCSVWMLSGIVKQHHPTAGTKDPHFPSESKSKLIYYIGLHAILWNLCIMIGSVVMMVLLKRAGRLKVLFTPFEANSADDEPSAEIENE